MRELSLNVMDIVQNSISANASVITVSIAEQTVPGTLEIVVEDNGCGMTEEQVANVQSPFFTTRTTRPVGLGVPLFKMAAEMTGGSFSIRSKRGVGTRTQAIFCTNHIDMTPLGDINETILLLLLGNPAIDFVYRHSRDEKCFELDTRTLKEALDGVPFSQPEVTAWLKEYLAEGQASLDDNG